MKNSGLLALLTMMAALTALSMDIYLPSLPSLTQVFDTDSASVALTLSCFVLTFACGQLVYGPLADRFGRRRPLYVGLALYLVANAICALAPTIEVLILGRALQGLGAGVGVVICNAIVRDRFEGAARTAAIARIAACVALAPITAPLIGAFLHTHLDWRASFLFLACFGGAVLAISWRKLPETFPGGVPFSPWRSYRRVQNNPTWRGWTLVNAFSFTALFAYIGTSSQLLVGEMGLSPERFSLLFSSNAITFLLGSVLASRVVRRFGPLPMAAWGCGQIVLGGTAMLIGHGLGWHGPAAVVLPMYLVTSGVAMAMPAGAAGALEPFAEAAGAASALQGFARFGLAACAVALAGAMAQPGTLVLGTIIIFCGCVALVGLGGLATLQRKVTLCGDAISPAPTP